MVKNANPKFEGHYQPKVPLWGYRDESDPKEMARSIDAMADAGIGAVIFDWYRYDDDIHGGVMIEKALRQGFLQAPNCNRIKFALMWANHTYIDCHPFAPGVWFNNAPVWRKGEVGRAAFDRHTQDAIESYFKQPNYWKIDGRPYFSIYDLDKLIQGLGGVAETRAVLDNFRTRVMAAGFSDLHLNIVDQQAVKTALELVRGQPFPEEPTRTVETVLDLLAALKVESSTMYTWVHHLSPMLLQTAGRPDYELSVALKAVSQPDKMCGVVRIEDDAGPRWIATAETDVTTAGFKTLSVRSDARWTGTLKNAEIYLSSQSNADVIVDNLSFIKLPATELTKDVVLGAGAGFIAVDYDQYGREAMRIMDERPGALGVTYFPHVSMGWDGSPRNYSMGMVINNTPEKWGEFLRQTRAWLQRHPESRGIVTLNSWNEWVAGSYIEPDTKNGMQYLQAVRDVFGVTPTKK
ncbi:MAG: glycoside hydrolase family 99-like domain-containing protein [Pirellulaceae bacterium]